MHGLVLASFKCTVKWF